MALYAELSFRAMVTCVYDVRVRRLCYALVCVCTEECEVGVLCVRVRVHR